jgi:hypothetical protein
MAPYIAFGVSAQVLQLMARLEELLLSYRAAEYRRGLSDRPCATQGQGRRQAPPPRSFLRLGLIRLALANNLRAAFTGGRPVPAGPLAPAMRGIPALSA